MAASIQDMVGDWQTGAEFKDNSKPLEKYLMPSSPIAISGLRDLAIYSSRIIYQILVTDNGGKSTYAHPAIPGGCNSESSTAWLAHCAT